MLPLLINKLERGENLTQNECYHAVNTLKEYTEEDIGRFLTLLHKKNETAEELSGFISALKKTMIPLETHFECLDIAGTGGDKANTVNISSAASLVTASLNIYTAKHGNRSVSSQCGSADFLESLGININLTPQQAKNYLEQNHFVFLYAPNFHPNLQHYKALRKTLGVPTTFNLVGPLLNPVQPKYAVIGVYSPDLLNLFAETLIDNDVERALIVHSCGLDEISLLGPTQVIEINQGTPKQYCIEPKDYGFSRCELAAIQGGDVATNKELLLNALSGAPGAISDTITLNAAAGLYASTTVPSIQQGVELARHQLQSGNTLNFIRQLLKNQVIYA